MTEKTLDTDIELSSTENTLQSVHERSVLAKNVADPDSAVAENIPERYRRTISENLKIKKIMAMAMLEMGIVKKDVMEILNINIK